MHENARIDYGAVIQAGSVHYQASEAIRRLEECLEQHGTVDLYQAYLERSRGGSYVIEELDARTKPDGYGDTGTYKFRCLRVVDEDGKERDAKGGDTYWLHVGTRETFIDPRTGIKKPMNTRQRRSMERMNKRRGDQHDINLWRQLKVGKDRVVEVGFIDACNIIVNHTEVCNYKSDGFHFEPYYETDKPKRGRPPKADQAPEELPAPEPSAQA